jgi:hypothetical protein
MEITVMELLFRLNLCATGTEVRRIVYYNQLQIKGKMITATIDIPLEKLEVEISLGNEIKIGNKRIYLTMEMMRMLDPEYMVIPQ